MVDDDYSCDTSEPSFCWGLFINEPPNIDVLAVAPAADLDLTGCALVEISSAANGSTTQDAEGCVGGGVSFAVQTQTDGGEILLVVVRHLTVPEDTTLRLVGDKPVALVAFGDITIGGSVTADADYLTPGPGGTKENVNCPGRGADGERDGGDRSGAGGGSHQFSGGTGGLGDDGDAEGGAPGDTFGDGTLEPLRGGCPGGKGNGGGSSKGGSGGGAVLLAASRTLLTTDFASPPGLISAGGGGVLAADEERGAGGGGSGGALLLFGDVVELNGWLSVKGGGGGGGGGDIDIGPASENGSGDPDIAAPGGSDPAVSGWGGNGGASPDPTGQGGSDAQVDKDAGGGGGGGSGYIRVIGQMCSEAVDSSTSVPPGFECAIGP